MPRLIDVYASLLREPLAMRQDAIVAIHRAALAGDDSPFAFAGKAPKVSGSVAIIPIYGMIQQRNSGLLDYFGGTSTDQVGSVFMAAMRNEQIKGVLLDVDSPGGTVPGTPELSRMIYEARGGKPVVAAANPQAASAAYWIASAAERFFVTPSGDVGSIGVWTAHVDESVMDEQHGIKVTVVSAGKYKTEGNPWERLSDEAKQSMQARVDEIYDEFVLAVARNRGVSTAKARSTFGEGRMVRASAAVEAGMVDRAVTWNRVLGEMGVNRAATADSRAADLAIQDELCALWGTPEAAGEVEQATEQVPQGASVDVLRRRMELKRKQTA